jgi:hypothetical protein
MGMGIVTLATLGTVLSFPFKGKAGMGMGIVTLATLGTVLTFPFKGKAGMGMGYAKPAISIP